MIFRNSQRRGYLRNGRLIYNEEATKFSWIRAVILLTLVTFLWISNPMRDGNPHLRQLLSHAGVLQNNKIRYDSSNAVLQKQNWADFGVFAIQNDGMRAAVVHFAGSMELECPYMDSDWGWFCTSVFRDEFAYGKPVIYDPADRVHTTYRAIVWLLVGCSGWVSCFRKGPLDRRGFVLDSFGSLLLDPLMVRRPLVSLFQKLFLLNSFVYPTLEAMNVLVSQQHKKSPFAYFESPDLNFAVSVGTLFAVAALWNGALRVWFGSFVLGFNALSAASIGYFAHHQKMLQQSVSLFPVVIVSPRVATWTMIVLMWLNESLPAAIGWCLAYSWGLMFSDYQHQNRFLGAAVVGVFTSAQRSIRDIFAF